MKETNLHTHVTQSRCAAECVMHLWLGHLHLLHGLVPHWWAILPTDAPGERSLGSVGWGWVARLLEPIVVVVFIEENDEGPLRSRTRRPGVGAGTWVGPR